MKRWPLVLIAAPAAVAVWSGWVGLGEMCGFGPVDLLPGIAHFTVNTAITLPVGVEAYGAYALGAWLAPGMLPMRTRRFAKRSAIGSLALGMLGQVAYHLLAAAGRTRAPWPVVVLVSCIPVVVLGFGAGLTHLMRVAAPATAPATAPVPEAYPAVPERPAPDAEMDQLLGWLTTGDIPGPRREPPRSFANARTGLYRLRNQDGDLLYVGVSLAPEFRFYDHARLKDWWPEVADKSVEWFSNRADALVAERAAIAAERPRYNALPGVTPFALPVYPDGSELSAEEVAPFAEDLVRGDIPSIRRIRKELRVGQPRAQEIQARLRTLVPDTEAAA